MYLIPLYFQIINFYMGLISEKHDVSFFYTKLVAAGITGVGNWMKDVDIFNKQLWLIPVHQRVHWCLSTVDLCINECATMIHWVGQMTFAYHY